LLLVPRKASMRISTLRDGVDANAAFNSAV
jgi:hypothetical protein